MPPDAKSLAAPGCIVALAALGVIAMALLGYFNRSRDRLVSVSPDRSHRIVVREGIRLIDRNFHIVLADQRTGTERVIFRSQDQSPTIRRERFVWSDDSSKVALLGDKYYVVPESTLENGDIVFLVYDVKKDQLWCNTDHDRGFDRISAAQAADLLGEKIHKEPE